MFINNNYSRSHPAPFCLKCKLIKATGKLTKYKILVLAIVASMAFSNVYGQSGSIVKTTGGYIHGAIEGQSFVFKGVPYAAPPVGALRFKAPEKVKPWKDTLLCASFGSVAAQFSSSNGTTQGSEDCLRLNIYQPRVQAGRRLPILVWIHGGGMTAGSGMTQNGHAFSDQDSIITITINYRLGVFGFLYLGNLGQAYHTSGNNGLLDCIMALRWIRENAAEFGGDADRVTVMGESAGAKLASSLLVSPLAKGYFGQLILESGSVQCIRDSATAKAIQNKLLATLGISDARQLLDLPTDRLIKAQALVCNGAAGTNYFGPVDDGVVINGDPYQYIGKSGDRSVRVLAGTNKVESVLFMNMDKRLYHPDSIVLNAWFGKNYPLVLRAYERSRAKTAGDSAAINVLTQYMYQMHSYRLADALAKAGNNIWMYRFDYSRDSLGATHGRELPFVWSFKTDRQGGQQALLSAYMHQAWVSFIRRGDPGTAEEKHWPQYGHREKNIFLFDTHSAPVLLNRIFNDTKYPSAGFIL